MGAWCDKMKEASSDFYRWAFPKKIEIPDCLQTLYETLFPEVDWGSVSFYSGKPWYAKSENVKGITIPDYYGVHELKIYFSDEAGVYDPCSCSGLETPVHEGYHVQQYREIVDGAGIGLARGFIIPYVGGIWQGGGSNHHMEGPAHSYGHQFEDCCTASPCDCTSSPPTLNSAAIDNIVSCDPSLVVRDTGVSFWDLMINATPGAGWLWEKAGELAEWACSFDRDEIEIDAKPGRKPGLNDRSWKAIGQWVLKCSVFGFWSLIIRLIAIVWVLIYGIIALGVTILLAILLPIIDLLFLIAAGLLWVATGIVCAAEWFWEKVREGLIASCDWAENLERTCKEWQRDREKKCTEEEDQGYEKCEEKEDQGYNKCCDWWPCSWACDALVWVSKMVCVAWTWVSKIVCVAWTWVVSWTCVAFTWVVKGLTCWAK